MADVETQFKAALNVIQSLPKSGSYKPSPDMMLQFYSLFKQATEGRCNRSKPWSFDVINKAKWDAWNRLGDMSKEEAMKNYVLQLTKVMKNFPLPSDYQIIEALPASDKAADFINTLGDFYEIVDPNCEQAKELKSYTDLNIVNEQKLSSLNGNDDLSSHKTNCANGHESGDASKLHASESEAVPPRRVNVEEVIEAGDSHKHDSQQQEAIQQNDSDDEFCDTSAEMTAVRERKDSGSPSTSTLSSASTNSSPPRMTKKAESSSNFRGHPHQRGGEHGTRGIDESVQLNMGESESHQKNLLKSHSSLNNLQHSSRLTGGAGGGNEPNPLDNKRQSEVQERIAVALLQLQRDMHSVLNRLTTLETITISRHQDEQSWRRCWIDPSISKPSWWPFDELSPRTTLFILIWPFIARMLIAVWTKSKAQRRH